MYIVFLKFFFFLRICNNQIGHFSFSKNFFSMSFPFGIYLPINPIQQYQISPRIGSGGSYNKKKPIRRVARLVNNGDQNENSPKTSISMENLDQKLNFTEKSNSRSPYQGIITQCVGQVINDRICFILNPNSPKIFCPFAFSHSTQHRVVLKISPFVGTIPFILNDVPFSFTGIEIDITDHLNDGENHLTFNTLSISINIEASIQWRAVQDISYFIQKIITEFPPMEIPPENQFISDFCPISKKQIVIAVRGMNCKHSQCFDLESFLNIIKDIESIECPLCGNRLTLNSIRHDPQFLKNCGSNFLMDDLINGADFF